MPGIQTNSQRCSEYVFKSVVKFNDTEKSLEKRKRYKALCKDGGGTLRTVGLIQFLIYLKSKDDHHMVLLKHIALEYYNIFESQNVTDGEKAVNNLLEKVHKSELPEYMFMTRRILSLLQWHKRIVSVVLES